MIGDDPITPEELEQLKDIEAVTAEHFLTEDELVEWLNSDDDD